jgi:uncharacterized protein YycO
MCKHWRGMARAGLSLLLIVALLTPTVAAAAGNGPVGVRVPPLPALKTVQELSGLSAEARLERIHSDPQFAAALHLLESPEFQAQLQKAWESPQFRAQVWQTYTSLRQAMPALDSEAVINDDERLPNFTQLPGAALGNHCDFSLAKHGYILVSYTSGFFPVSWAKNWTHAGFMNNYADGECFEAQFDGVKVRRDLADWQAADHAGVYKLKDEAADTIAAQAYNFAFNQYDGKPYNFNWLDMHRQDAAYCSQLVWYGYNQAGKNLDANSFDYWLFLYSVFDSILNNPLLSAALAAVVMFLVVAPDELTMSSLVEVVSRD